MNPQAHLLWKAPRWALAILLAVLGMLGPFSIDTYIPAFSGIAAALGATPVEMQQTLSAYLFGFAFMSLFHGALADSFGRRPVILWGIAVFTLASAGCALSQTIGQLVFFRALQGLSTGAGIVVSRAVIRDMFPPAQAQKVMSQVTIYFGVAPAIAPIIGGWLFVHAGWHSIFWFLTLVGVALWTANFRLLPETLHVEQRQPFNVRHLMRGYMQLGTSARFVLLALASGVPFNGMFLYVLSAPVFLIQHLGLPETGFGWFFIPTVSGMMAGSALSARLAGALSPARTIALALGIMILAAGINLAVTSLMAPGLPQSVLPIMLHTFGMAIGLPCLTLLALDYFPEHRGLASSCQSFLQMLVSAVCAGVAAPALWGSVQELALGSAASLLMSLACCGLWWLRFHPRPEPRP